ncbi:MAG: hypothetical protein ACLUR5_02210 [Eubacterium ventriosum]
MSEAIKETMDFKKEDKANVHLIHGITGSGKTEVLYGFNRLYYSKRQISNCSDS